MNYNIVYDCRWSHQANYSFINDYNIIQHAVFGGLYNESSFNYQFTDNIYGPSVVVVVYVDGAPVAARALWRNDINGMEAYQPGQTCVLEQFRGKGIFSEMTKRAIALLPPNAIIYNFPNKNSFSGYIKMGWKLQGEYRPKLLLSNREYKKEHPTEIDERYATWWLNNVKGIKYVKYFGHYYLCRHDTPRPYYHIIGLTQERIAKQFPKAGKWGLFFYLSNKLTFYNKKYSPLRVVAKCENKIYVPSWKIDAI